MQQMNISSPLSYPAPVWEQKENVNCIAVKKLQTAQLWPCRCPACAYISDEITKSRNFGALVLY